jgi:hypothetical protein
VARNYPRPYTLRFNAQSWVETDDVELEKPTGTCRIFYVGDSFTEGAVPMEQSVPSLVEKHLNETYSPDLIVINVDMTDTFDDWEYRENLMLDDEGSPWAVPPGSVYDRVYIETVFRIIGNSPVHPATHRRGAVVRIRRSR